MEVLDWDTLPTQLGLTLAAFALTALVGLERRLRRKSAGLRTHALVGTGAAIFTLVSAYGFEPLPGIDAGPDPSRVAAQIITGIGFLGAGVIFMNRDVVHGLTTAASIWLSAAIGMACGAGLLALGVAGTVLHFVTALVLAPISRRLPSLVTPMGLRLRYELRREFAPYLGVEWSRASGESAELLRAAGEDDEDFRVLLGLRLWY